MRTFIYALVDPTTDLIRYVGKSNTPEKRLKLHMAEARSGVRFSHRLNWLRFLINCHQIPKLIILEECDVERWIDREKWWIRKYKSITKLVNSTDGGEGSEGYKHSMERKNKISLSQLRSWSDPNTKKFRSFSMRGKNKTGNLGKSQIAKKHISISLKGKRNALGYKWTKEQKEHLSEALKKCGKMRRRTSFTKGTRINLWLNQ